MCELIVFTLTVTAEMFVLITVGQMKSHLCERGSYYSVSKALKLIMTDINVWLLSDLHSLDVKVLCGEIKPSKNCELLIINHQTP